MMRNCRANRSLQSHPSARRKARLALEPLEDRTVPALIAAYGFEENQGGTTADSAGNDDLGTISGASWTTSGRFGNALSFDGVNDWVTVNDTAALDLTTGMTLMAWVRPTAINGWETVILKERGTNGLAYSLYAADDAGRPPAGYVNIGG